jgi:hypothetical protein
LEDSYNVIYNLIEHLLIIYNYCKNMTIEKLLRPGVSNSVSYVRYILTKKGLRAALRGKMSPRAAIGDLKCLYTTKKVVSAIIWVILKMSRAAQTHLAGHMRPAGRVFQTPDLDNTNMTFLQFLKCEESFCLI